MSTIILGKNGIIHVNKYAKVALSVDGIFEFKRRLFNQNKLSKVNLRVYKGPGIFSFLYSLKFL